jgi:hypothetical protein
VSLIWIWCIIFVWVSWGLIFFHLPLVSMILARLMNMIVTLEFCICN